MPVVRRELTAAGAGRRGRRRRRRSACCSRSAIPPAGSTPTRRPRRSRPRRGPDDRADRGVDGSATGSSVLTELDPGRQAFLDDHRIDGTPVLPGVMGIEALRRGGGRRCCPGWQVVALEDVELLAPFKFYRDEPRTLELQALLRDGGDGSAGRRLPPGRTPRAARQGEQETVHFTGRARLTREAPAAPPVGRGARRRRPDGRRGPRGDLPRLLPRPRLPGARPGLARQRRRARRSSRRDLPPDHEPPEQPTEIAPRLIELCFQTAGVWELGTAGRMALPTHVDRVIALRRRGRARRAARRRHAARRTDRRSTPRSSTRRASVRVRLEGYRTIELPGASGRRRARADPRGDGLGRGAGHAAPVPAAGDRQPRRAGDAR